MALASYPRERNDCDTNNDCKARFLQYQQRLQSSISAVQTTIANHNARNANDYAYQSRMRDAHFGSQL
jgi:hypothetical protein